MQKNKDRKKKTGNVRARGPSGRRTKGNKNKIQLSDGNFYILRSKLDFEFETVLDDEEGNFYGVSDIYACRISATGLRS